MLTGLITGDVHFDYLVNLMPVSFLCNCKVIILSFAISKYLKER